MLVQFLFIGTELITELLLALYKKDKSFRRYASSVERALSLWDTAQQEWADYISFLGRLLKACISIDKFPWINSLRICHRLGNPSTSCRIPSNTS